MDRSNIEKIAKNSEDRLLLAKIWDKITAGIRKNIPANTGFLTLRELDMTRYLFGDLEGLHSFGGYPETERKMLIYLPVTVSFVSSRLRQTLVHLRLLTERLLPRLLKLILSTLSSPVVVVSTVTVRLNSSLWILTASSYSSLNQL